VEKSNQEKTKVRTTTHYNERFRGNSHHDEDESSFVEMAREGNYKERQAKIKKYMMTGLTEE
jgi:hypothetical protein